MFSDINILFLFFDFLGPHSRHMEVARLGVKSELLLLAYTTATATPNPSHVCSTHHSSQQCRILNPLSEARDWTHVLWILIGFVTAEPWRKYVNCEIQHNILNHIYFTLYSFQFHLFWPKVLGYLAYVTMAVKHAIHVITVSCHKGNPLGTMRLLAYTTATAPIGFLAWEPPYAMCVALKKDKKKKMNRGVHLVAQQKWTQLVSMRIDRSKSMHGHRKNKSKTKTYFSPRPVNHKMPQRWPKKKKKKKKKKTIE